MQYPSGGAPRRLTALGDGCEVVGWSARRPRRPIPHGGAAADAPPHPPVGSAARRRAAGAAQPRPSARPRRPRRRRGAPGAADGRATTLAVEAVRRRQRWRALDPAGGGRAVPSALTAGGRAQRRPPDRPWRPPLLLFGPSRRLNLFSVPLGGQTVAAPPRQHTFHDPLGVREPSLATLADGAAGSVIVYHAGAEIHLLRPARRRRRRREHGDGGGGADAEIWRGARVGERCSSTSPTS